MRDIFFSRWLWIIVISVVLIISVPLLVIWAILNLPPYLRLFATIALVILWGIASGYKDWVASKRKETEESEGG